MSVLAQVDDWPVDVVAVAVIGPDGILDHHGPLDRALPWASVTKPCTALVVLTLVEQGLVELDEPWGPEGATVRHLLAHASGLPFERGAPGGGVGERRVYSNLGYHELGELVADRTGRPFGEALHARVLRPLELTGTQLEGSPAEGLRGPLADLARLAQELLRPTLVEPATLREATSVQFPGLAGVVPGYGRHEHCDWGLGFELRDAKHPHWTSPDHSPGTFGHFGGSGSYLWVDPEIDLAACELASEPFGDWAVDRWAPFNRAIRDAYAGR